MEEVETSGGFLDAELGLVIGKSIEPEVTDIIDDLLRCRTLQRGMLAAD